MADNETCAKRPKFSKQGIIGFLVCILLLIGLLVISPHLPDTRPEAIRRELVRQGHSVESMDFEFVRNRDEARGWVFQSSEPLYFNGHYVSQWSVVRCSLGARSRPTRYFVEPYPLPVSVAIAFTTEEFERISEYAGGQPIEVYLRRIILGKNAMG